MGVLRTERYGSCTWSHGASRERQPSISASSCTETWGKKIMRPAAQSVAPRTTKARVALHSLSKNLSDESDCPAAC
eukprot:scaffold358_cov256-Pinguiococcus_pyrenoidosus.AAC.1